ncbi:MAG TPA: hypothetical protein VEV84_10170, partial [Pyrinomonadaceae bacterium]|nr:hypothetical protein [Pyrinomonadaceae bacterium]
MKRHLSALTVVVVFLAVGAVYSQSRDKIEIVPPKSYVPPKITQSAKLQAILDAAVNGLLKSYADGGSFKDTDIAATLIDLRDPKDIQTGYVRGDERIYPASVVKMFYMNALERQLEDGKITLTPEMARGLKDMIVVSSNEAT